MATSTTSNLAPTTQTYYTRYLLDRPEMDLEIYDHFKKFKLPKNAGRTMSMRRYTSDTTAATTPLTEGANPSLNSISSAEVTAAVALYGKAYGYTSWMKDTDAIDPNVEDTIRNLASYNAKITLDTLAQTEAVANAVNLFANGHATGTMVAGDTFSIVDVRKVTTSFMSANVRPYENGRFHCILHPEQLADFKAESATGSWSELKYTMKEGIVNGKLDTRGKSNYFGTLEGVEFYTSTLIDSATHNSVACYRALFFADEALGAVELEAGNSFNVIVKAPGTSGIGDVMDELGSVAWKARLAVKNLDTSAANSKNPRCTMLITAP